MGTMTTTVGSVEWEWSSDDKRWVAYSAECSAAIEAAYAAGESSVPLCLSSTSSSSHTVIFHGFPQRQVSRQQFSTCSTAFIFCQVMTAVGSLVIEVLLRLVGQSQNSAV